MINWGKSDKIIEIKGKTDKSNTCKSLVVEIFHSFIQRTSSDLTIFFLLKCGKTKKMFCLMKFLESSSLSCCTISTDIPDPLSPPLPIVYCFQ